MDRDCKRIGSANPRTERPPHLCLASKEVAPMSNPRIGIIGGSGLYQMPELTEIDEIEVETPFGRPSDKFVLDALAFERAEDKLIRRTSEGSLDFNLIDLGEFRHLIEAATANDADFRRRHLESLGLEAG